MTTLFLIHSPQDAACALRLRHDLATQGATIWADASGATPPSEHAWQAGLNDSRVVVVVWSVAAAQDATVAQQIHHAQWLYKSLVVVAIDTTPLPAAIAQAPLIRSAPPCTDAAAQLLPHLSFGGDPAAQPPTTRNEAVHIFPVSCAQGHVTYFDKRAVCPANGSVTRSVVSRNGTQLDVLRLRCGTTGCPEWIAAEVDCEGYR